MGQGLSSWPGNKSNHKWIQSHFVDNKQYQRSKFCYQFSKNDRLSLPWWRFVHAILGCFIYFGTNLHHEPQLIKLMP